MQPRVSDLDEDSKKNFIIIPESWFFYDISFGEEVAF